MSSNDLDMDESDRSHQSQSPSNTRPITSYAINFFLRVYDDGIENRTENTMLQVQKLTRSGSRNVRLDAIKNASSETLPSLMPSKEELSFDPDDDTVVAALWVGMLPSTLIDAPKVNKDAAKGDSVNSTKAFTPIPTDPRALRVICPVDRHTATYYALVEQDQDSKLCHAIMLPGGDYVCFFPEFRTDDTPTYADRKELWAAKVREALNQGQDREGGAHQTADATKSAFEALAAGSSEPAGFLQSSEVPGTESSLHDAQALSEDGVAIPKQNIQQINTQLYLFINGMERPTAEFAEEVLEEIQELWPRLARCLTSDILLQIHQCIRVGRITVRYRHAGRFIAELARSIAQRISPFNDAEAARIVEDVIEHICVLKVHDEDDVQGIREVVKGLGESEPEEE